MAEAVDNRLRHMRNEDLHAMTVPDTRPANAWGTAGDELASIRGAALPRNEDEWSGEHIYDAYCATCHQAQGQGSFDGKLPSLFHNTALGRTNTNNLIMAILEGVHRQPDVDMPGFAHDLSDRQVATLGTYTSSSTTAIPPPRLRRSK